MIFTEKEIYKLNGAKQDLPGFDDKYLNIVDYILKITDEIWEQRAIWVINETYEKDVLIHSGAEQIRGIESVISGTINTLSTFPDRKMNGEAVIWSKNKKGEFFSSHRISSKATNLGESAFGQPTGKNIFFRTIADCAVKNNKIYEEWLVRDNLHLVKQLGFDPVEMAKRDTRYNGKEINPNFKVIENGKCYSFDLKNPIDLVHSLFEDVWKTRAFEKLDDYYYVLAKVHSICEKDLIGSTALRSYLENILDSFPDSKLEVQRITCNDLEIGSEVAVRWKMVGTHARDGFFGAASGKKIVLPGISHYIIKEGKIFEEWMVFDGFDVLCQIYADDEIDNNHIQTGSGTCSLHNKKRILSFVEELNGIGDDTHGISNILNKYLAPDISLNITKPFGEIKGIDQYENQFWQPLLQAFPDLENQPYIVVGGAYEEREYVSTTGNFIGTWSNDWLGIPATNQVTWLRYSATFMMDQNRIVKAWYFFDILDVMRQAGFHFYPNKGVDWVPPIPMTGDGIVNYKTDKSESEKSLRLTNAMLEALGEYDGITLESMGQERFWDVKNMMWYGPSGIGTTKGLKGFQNNHQLPFLIGFPDRGITPKKTKEYFCQIGDGNYSCDFGFPAMYGTHNGDGWLGLKATGKNVTMRVVDYWRREGERLKENWVFIDLIDVLEQLGINIFELLAKEIELKK